MPETRTIWTIGHSTRTQEAFLSLLEAHGIRLLADVRHYPGSRRFPHFNRERLKPAVEEAGVRYAHLPGLGGRRKARPDSPNTAWRNEAFRGYADYMETPAFREAAERLETLAREAPAAVMCAEAVWWRCHRSMIADWLKSRGWTVLHILDEGRAEEHPYTPPARIVRDRLTYR